MEKELQYLLHLTKCSLWDDVPEQAAAVIDWNKLQILANQTKLDTFVSYGLKLGGGLNCPKEIYEPLFKKIRKSAVGRVVAADELSNMQAELQLLGILSAVVKGPALASAYHHPELRGGCDIDVYVDEKQEKKVYRWAADKGYKTEKRVSGTHHGKITHSVLGLIELHVSLSNADEALVESVKGKDALLLHPHEDFCKVKNCGNEITTIGMTDHMIFIVSHMINHYLHGEAQARMLVDVNMFFDTYQSKLDLERFYNCMEELHYDKFFQCVLRIGNQYLGFHHQMSLLGEADENEVEELLLNFCEGIMEKEDALRVYDEYCKRTIPGGFKSIIYKIKILGTNVRTAFQLRRQMSWQTIIKIGWQRVRNIFLSGKETEQGSSDGVVAARRLELLKKLNLYN